MVAVAAFDLQQLDAPLVQVAAFAQPALASVAAGAAALLTVFTSVVLVVAAVAAFDLQQPAADLLQVADFAQPALVSVAAGAATVLTSAVLAVEALAAAAFDLQQVLPASADFVHCALVKATIDTNITNNITNFFIFVVNL